VDKHFIKKKINNGVICMLIELLLNWLNFNSKTIGIPQLQ